MAIDQLGFGLQLALSLGLGLAVGFVAFHYLGLRLGCSWPY